MRFIIKKERLLKSLSIIQGVVEKKAMKPILENVLIEVVSGRMHFTATDLEIAIRGSCEVEVVEEGKSILLAKKVMEIVKELSSENVTFVLKDSLEEGSSIEMSCGNAVFNIKSVDPNEFPTLPRYEDVELFPIDSHTLRDMIKKTIFAASVDEKRHNINGVFFEKEGEKLRMVCTDGHRLSIVEEENVQSKNMKFEKGVVFPKKGMNELKRIIEEEREESFVYFGVKGNNGIFKIGDLLLIMRLVEREFPDYTVFIPKENDKRFVINRSVFLSSLKRVSLLSGEGSRAVMFCISPGKLEMKARSSDYGEAYDRIEVEYQGKELNVTFNAAYFIEALSILESREISVELKDEETGAMLEPVEGGKHRCVVMPMRI